MYPSEELGSPSLALSIEVPRSPSLPGNGTPLWDNMSLPSSPSPKVPVPDFNMDLDRWAKRGFSEDLTLPPRQIEKPFRFLDLPLEIRNIVYELTFNDLPTLSCDGFACHCHRRPCFASHPCQSYIQTMKHQYQLPSVASVNKCIRLEVITHYYETTVFDWYWDPLKVRCGSRPHRLSSAIKLLVHTLKFARANGVQIKSIIVRSPCNCHKPTESLKGIAASVRFFASLQKSLTSRVHPAVREFKFADESSLARRIFDFAGSLVSPELEDDELQESTLRQFLWDDVEGRPVIGFIEELEDEIEAQDRWFAEQARRQKKVTERAQNKAKGPERWGGVLRSRPGQD
ncbi:hypothetical protein KCU83_g9281, partial [Aureobasidium melanogenum]